MHVNPRKVKSLKKIYRLNVRFAPESRWGGWLPLPASRCAKVWFVINNHEQ